MSLEMPKILSVIIVPSGGWDIAITLDYGGAAVAVTATVPEGRYFMAWDGQDDDFLWKLCDVLTTAIRAATGDYDNAYVRARIGDDHKVRLIFFGDFALGDAASVLPMDPIRIRWTAGDSDLAKALGADHTADETVPSPSDPDTYAMVWTAPYQHAYGWYADEEGLLKFKPLLDVPSAKVLQERSLSGLVKTQQISETLYDSAFELYAVREATMLSNGKGYNETPSYPYERNAPLECWFYEAVQGKEFRFYRNEQLFDTSTSGNGFTQPEYFDEALDADSATPGTTITDAAKAWQVDRWAGCLVHLPSPAPLKTLGVPDALRNYIVSNTATVLTIDNAWHAYPEYGDTRFFIADGRYGTYVLDVKRMSRFDPTEINGVSRFNITVPLLRYVE